MGFCQWWRSVASRAVGSEEFAGVLLLLSVVVALALANSSASDWYAGVRDARLGVLGRDLSARRWASDGLLAVFFFVVGLELKREFVSGRLRSPRSAVTPIVAGVGGAVVPAVVFVLTNLGAGSEALRGWAVPTATDAAFSVAVFGLVGGFLPPALRVFLLMLALVDDLIAVAVIATVYTSDIMPAHLAAAVLPLAAFAAAARRNGWQRWAMPFCAVAVWALAPVAVTGAALAFAVPVLGSDGRGRAGGTDLSGCLLDRWGPVSSFVALPVFAFLASGVGFGGLEGLRSSLSHTVAFGVVFGLVVGKPLGVLLSVFLITRIPAVARGHDMRWADLAGVAFLAGIGFTVSLFVGGLSYPDPDSRAADDVKVGVLVGSLVSSLAGGAVLAARNLSYRQACA